jgi:hypothetical protein
MIRVVTLWRRQYVLEEYIVSSSGLRVSEAGNQH